MNSKKELEALLTILTYEIKKMMEFNNISWDEAKTLVLEKLEEKLEEKK